MEYVVRALNASIGWDIGSILTCNVTPCDVMRPCATKSLAKLLERREESKFSMFELAIFLRWHIKDTLRDEFEPEDSNRRLPRRRRKRTCFHVTSLAEQCVHVIVQVVAVRVRGCLARFFRTETKQRAREH